MSSPTQKLTLMQIEQIKHRVKDESLNKLAAAYGVSVATIKRHAHGAQRPASGKYPFENSEYKISEIKAQFLPGFSEQVIRTRLDEGCTTKHEILYFATDAKRRAAGRRGSETMKRNGFDRTGGTKTPCGVRV